MGRLMSSLTALLMALSLPAYSSGQPQAAATLSPIELTISGPQVIRVGQDLRFKATLINRSAAPVALMFYHDGWAGSNFAWKITDLSDRVLPPPPPKGPQGFVCLVSGAQPEEAIQVLQPGEKFVYAIPEDPSDEFAFHGKGFYKVTLTYEFDPAAVSSAKNVAEEYGGRPDAAGPYPKREVLLKTPRMIVTSNVWQMYLAD
jgi:hypothetical protein